MLWMCAADNSLVYGSALETPPINSGIPTRLKRYEEGREGFCPRCAICCDLAFAFKLEFFYYAGFLLREKADAMGKR